MLSPTFSLPPPLFPPAPSRALARVKMCDPVPNTPASRAVSLPPPLFATDDTPAFWDTLDVTTALEPLSELEKSRLREKLPLKIANFLIRRADDAVRLRETRGDTDTTFLSRLLRDLPSDVVDWENAENKEYRSYVYETSLGAPSFRRRGSSLFGGGDGLPDLTPPGEATMAGKEGGGEDVRRYSLFVGNVGGIDEQASKAGYSVLALLAIVIIAKLMFGLVSFFVSFTFSFFAIFALSAAIFMVFFLFKF